MSRHRLPLLVGLVGFGLLTTSLLPVSDPQWGFFGHRRINRLAVFTLDVEMMPFFRHYLDYVTEHAVDPDKRRYATRHEAVRHYMDLDHWGQFPFPALPRDWTTALLRYASLEWVSVQGDTVRWAADSSLTAAVWPAEMVLTDGRHTKTLAVRSYRDFFRQHVQPQYYEEEWLVAGDTLRQWLDWPEVTGTVSVIDHLSEHGILPYHLLNMQYRLTQAFRERDLTAILRHTSDMGHYIGDAHVPLHTTTNYNGQLTDQLGIHAFWESRIPELFADDQYDYWVGRARYIERPAEYFWDVVLTSHQLVDSVLLIEKELSLQFPDDQQYCYEERLNATIRTQCREYAAAYQRRMDGMVEVQMRAAIHAVGSVWYTAWVDAGQPNLSRLIDANASEVLTQEEAALERAFRQDAAKGRPHE